MKHKIKLLLFVLATVVVLGCLIFLAFVKESPEVCIKDRCFNVKIADDDAERASGLMFIEKLDDNAGMIFIFETSGNYSFWMKNTFIPLDIIWIDENKTIVYISKNNLPCNEICELIVPEKETMYVLEIKAGLAEKYGFKTGDAVWFHLV